MKVLVFGGSGLVGSKFIDLNKQNFEIKAPLVQEVDILDKDQISKIAEEFNPDSIINFAAYTNVEEAENQKGDKDGICFQINAIGAKNVSEVAKDFNKHLVHISTEYVFDGTKSKAPYTEEDQPNPINWYGQTKLEGEQSVLENSNKNVVMRISMPFSSYYDLKKDIARFFLEQLKTGNKIKAIEDQRVTPTLVNDIADVLKVLLEHQSTGIYHACSRDSVTPLEFAKTIAETFHLDSFPKENSPTVYSLISSINLAEYNKGKNAKLLQYSWLNPTKFEKEFGDEILHTVEEGLVIFKEEIDSRDNN